MDLLTEWMEKDQRRKIVFIENCQILSLCIYFTELLDGRCYNIFWICYGPEFVSHITSWTRIPPKREIFKCNVIMDCNHFPFRENDVLIYQKIKPEKSEKWNRNVLDSVNAIKIVLPSIHFDENEDTYRIMKENEIKNSVSIPLADCILNDPSLIISPVHPSTQFFIYIVKQILLFLPDIEADFSIFDHPKYQNRNYIELP